MLIALYMLNICVDSPDPFPNRLENLNYNDQESIIELVVEKVYGLGDVIPEYDDADAEDYTSSKTPTNLDNFILDQFDLTLQTEFILLRKENTFCSHSNFSTIFIEIDAPPPKV